MRSLVVWSLLGLCVSPTAIADEKGSRPPTEAPERFSFHATRFAVPINVELYAADESSAKKTVDVALEWMRRLDRVASDYDPDSEVRRLCDRPAGEWRVVSHDLGELIFRSMQYEQATEAAFDPTVGPLSHVWRKARRFKRLPDEAALARAKAASGLLGRIGIDCNGLDHPDPNTSPHGLKYRLPVDGMRLDFGGIAKGYAVDRAVQIFRSAGYDTFLIDAGGDIYAAGKPPGTDGWRVAVESRDTDQTTVLTLVDRAVATSGDTYQHVEIDGRRYSHIIDPRTKEPLESQPQVTVVSFEATDADAMASAFSVMGVEAGLNWVEKANALLGDEESEFAVAVRFEEDGSEIVGGNWADYAPATDD